MASRRQRPAMYNTPPIRTGGFGVLQVEAITNRPQSIARRHLAASQLRMRDIEPDELSSSEWVRFLVMPEHERERWMTDHRRRRRNSDESSSSADNDREVGNDKAEEARLEAEDARRVERQAAVAASASSSRSLAAPIGATPAVSIWARQFQDEEDAARPRPASPTYSLQRPMHMRRAVTDGIMEAPPTYENAVRARTPPPAYAPNDDAPHSPRSP
ncbi:hypothetical protein LTR97_002273 [Elasticomyces elasticus]|uniref:Uncharacterized protein n=1 Tax=Elasticomyces elasticus TaxID=574655 RepID=A0AAN8A4C1_9PEZI|nr:hypothetical protein LTR97_002273 [Elasticomyces elasticus]